MKTYKIRFGAPQRKIKIPGRRYHQTYIAEARKFICSDSFCARWLGDVTSQSNWHYDFLGFSITKLDDRKITKKFNMEEEMPELYKVLIAMRATIEGNKITAINKMHAIMLFKLVRHVHDKKYADIIELTSQLLDKKHSPLLAYIMACMHCDAKHGTSSDGYNTLIYSQQFFSWNSNNKFDVLKENPRLPNMRLFVYPLDIDHFINDVIPRTVSFQDSFITGYMDRSPIRYERAYNAMRVRSFENSYVNKNIKKLGELTQNMYRFAKRKHFNKLAELLPEQRYY